MRAIRKVFRFAVGCVKVVLVLFILLICARTGATAAFLAGYFARPHQDIVDRIGGTIGATMLGVFVSIMTFLILGSVAAYAVFTPIGYPLPRLRNLK